MSPVHAYYVVIYTHVHMCKQQSHICTYANSLDSLSLPHSQLMDKLNTDTEQAAVIADTTAVRISIHTLIHVHAQNSYSNCLHKNDIIMHITFPQLKMQNDRESRKIDAIFAERQQ